MRIRMFISRRAGLNKGTDGGEMSRSFTNHYYTGALFPALRCILKSGIRPRYKTLFQVSVVTWFLSGLLVVVPDLMRPQTTVVAVQSFCCSPQLVDVHEIY